MSVDLLHQVTGIGVCIGSLVPFVFWIAISLHRIANVIGRLPR